MIIYSGFMKTNQFHTTNKTFIIMKKSNLLIAVLIIMVTIMGCKKEDTTTEEEPLDTSLHSNNLNILPEGFSPSISYAWDFHYSITSGQPWEGVSSSGYHSGIQITAEAGRHGSEGPANWFKERAPYAASTDANPSTSFPTDLNFAFTGTITINGDSYPITIGQGHTGAQNNWWIGGEDWHWPSDNSYGEINTPDGKYRFTEDEMLSYLFWVKEN